MAERDLALVEMTLTDGTKQSMTLGPGGDAETYIVLTAPTHYVAHEQIYPTTGGAEVVIKRMEG